MWNAQVNYKTLIVQPCGHINAANADDWQQQFSAALTSEQYTEILVDMSQVESLDSAGLMAFVSALSLAQRLNQRFAICSLVPAVRIVFELTQLDRVFEILENADQFSLVALK